MLGAWKGGETGPGSEIGPGVSTGPGVATGTFTGGGIMISGIGAGCAIGLGTVGVTPVGKLMESGSPCRNRSKTSKSNSFFSVVVSTKSDSVSCCIARSFTVSSANGPRSPFLEGLAVA